MLKRYKSEEGKKLVYASYERLVALWGIPVEESDVDTRYGKTHIITAGSRQNPPLMLFHGVGDNSALMWIFNAKELAKHFFLIAVDAIGGSGKSEPDECYFKGFDQTLWIDDVVTGLKVEKMHIAGVSYGSYLTQLYAMERPEKTKKIICMAGAISLEGMKSNTFRMLRTFLPEALFPSEKNAVKLMRKLCGINYQVFTENKDLMQHWMCLLKYFNNQSMMFHKLKRFSREQVKEIQDRTLVMIGDSDPLGDLEKTTERLKEIKIPYKIFKETGHGINHEQASAINREMINFLSESV